MSGDLGSSHPSGEELNGDKIELAWVAVKIVERSVLGGTFPTPIQWVGRAALDREMFHPITLGTTRSKGSHPHYVQ